jgi:hypothetical protein
MNNFTKTERIKCEINGIDSARLGCGRRLSWEEADDLKPKDASKEGISRIAGADSPVQAPAGTSNSHC